MKNVVMARIDDRLLHGQVVVSWLPYLNADEVIILDEEMAADEFMKELILSSAPSGVDTYVLSLNETLSYLVGEKGSGRILILTKNISHIKALLENNIPIEVVNLGGLGYNEARIRYLNFISLSDDELRLLTELNNMENCNLQIQMVPNDKKYSLKELLKD